MYIRVELTSKPSVNKLVGATYDQPLIEAHTFPKVTMNRNHYKVLGKRDPVPNSLQSINRENTTEPFVAPKHRSLPSELTRTAKIEPRSSALFHQRPPPPPLELPPPNEPRDEPLEPLARALASICVRNCSACNLI